MRVAKSDLLVLRKALHAYVFKAHDQLALQHTERTKRESSKEKDVGEKDEDEEFRESEILGGMKGLALPSPTPWMTWVHHLPQASRSAGMCPQTLARRSDSLAWRS